MTASSSLVLIALLVVLSLSPCGAFLRPHLHFRREYPRRSVLSRWSARLFAAARYGPNEDITSQQQQQPEDDSNVADVEQKEWERAETARLKRQQQELQSLVQAVMTTTNPQHVPSIMTKHMELLLNIRGYEGSQLIERILKEAEAQGEAHVNQVMDAIEFILSFTEAFVDNAQTLDDYNKKLLGKIIKTMSKADTAARDREELLDSLMESEKENFTPGFLRHVEGECDRIAAAPSMTPESARLLEILRIIQARVLEELGKDMGEEALVLGQLLGYDDAKERLAVLDAGLTVRGIEFAKGMVALTEEALEGFTRVAGGADPDLVERVTEIDARLRNFISQQKATP
jgi:flagellar motor protein MotB